MKELHQSKVLNIFQRIHAIMGDISYIQKGEKKAAGMYTYVSHDAVSQALHPLFVKHGVVVIPTVKSMMQEGNRTSMVLEVTFINIDTPEDKFTIESHGYGIDTGDKGPGKCYSYAYKYALLKTFCLETGDDPDHDQNVKFEPPKESEPIIDLMQYESLKQFNLEELKGLTSAIKNNFKISSLQQLKAKDYDNVYNQLLKAYNNRKQP